MRTVTIKLELPGDLNVLRLPETVHSRLHELLDKQDAGEALTVNERREAEYIVDLAGWITLMRTRIEVAMQVNAQLPDAARIARAFRPEGAARE